MTMKQAVEAELDQAAATHTPLPSWVKDGLAGQGRRSYLSVVTPVGDKMVQCRRDPAGQCNIKVP